MLEIIIGAVIAVIVPVAVIFAYNKGVRTGMRIKDDKPPEKIQLPKIVKEKKVEKGEVTLEDQYQELANAQPEFMED